MKPIPSLTDKHAPNLQATHKSAGLSQTDPANRLDLSQSRISAMELDPASMRLDQLLSICASLQLELVLQTKGAMDIRARGRHRVGDGVTPNDLTLTRKNGDWYASVTLRMSDLACARERTSSEHRGLDLGINNWATLDDVPTIENPRWGKAELTHLRTCSDSVPRSARALYGSGVCPV